MIRRVVDQCLDVRRLCDAGALERWRPQAVICALIVSVAAGASAQPAAPRYADEAVSEVRRMGQPNLDDLRRSTLVGSEDDLAIALPDGPLISLPGRCASPVTKGGLIKVDCTVSDGPAYYFDAATRAMVESCSIWFPEPKRCPPRQWPVEVPGCDATVPASITGTWKLYALPAANGFSPLDDGWTMTLTGGSVTFAFSGHAPLQRSYEVLERSERRYSLEIRDTRFARTRIDVELAPCGLFAESAELCDVFCAHVAEEVGAPTEQQIRDVARRVTGAQDGEQVERMVAAMRESIEHGPPPIFLKRAFFRADGH